MEAFALTNKSIEKYLKLFRVSTNFPYDQKRLNQIHARRQALDRCLFFDLLLKDIAQIEEPTLYYPPSSLKALEDLFNAIFTANIDDLKHASLIYYLLKDLPTDDASLFAQDLLLPQTFYGIVDAFYALDNLQIEHSMVLITSPALTLNYHSKIVYTILKNSNRADGIRNVSLFMQTVDHNIEDEVILKQYYQTLLLTSLETAFSYQRKLHQQLRPKYFNLLLEFAFSSSNHHVLSLYNLPLDTNEEKALEQYLQSLDTASRQYLGTLRDMMVGRLHKSVDVIKERTIEDNQLDWEPLKDGLMSALGIRQFNSSFVGME